MSKRNKPIEEIIKELITPIENLGLDACPEKKIKEGAGSICGGVMSQSMETKGIKKYGIWFGMMAFVLPDKQYGRWTAYKKSGKEKEATKIFDRFAISSI